MGVVGTSPHVGGVKAPARTLLGGPRSAGNEDTVGLAGDQTTVRRPHHRFRVRECSGGSAGEPYRGRGWEFPPVAPGR